VSRWVDKQAGGGGQACEQACVAGGQESVRVCAGGHVSGRASVHGHDEWECGQ